MRTNLDSAHSIGLAGIQRGIQRMVKAGAALTREVSVDKIVDLKLAETQIRASSKVVRVADRSLGQLLDRLA
ncbi:MAG: hypothetical protein V3V08_11890 [Nannocystaceae bacterium]